MAVNAAVFREYLGLPPDGTEDAHLDLYLDAAAAKASAAGIPAFERNAQYDLFIYALAAMYYDNRGMVFSGAYQATAEENARRMINSFVLELRYTAPEEVVNGG